MFILLILLLLLFLVPCLRRVSQLAYGNGVDEDAETLMSFALDGAETGDSDGEDWVATHTSKG